MDMITLALTIVFETIMKIVISASIVLVMVMSLVVYFDFMLMGIHWSIAGGIAIVFFLGSSLLIITVHQGQGGVV